MKLISLLCLFMAAAFFSAYGQEAPRAFFELKTDTIQAAPEKEVQYSFTIIAPKQKDYHNYKVRFLLLESGLGTPGSAFYLPVDHTFAIDSAAEVRKTYTIKFKLSGMQDRLIKLGLQAFNPAGAEVSLEDYNQVKSVYVRADPSAAKDRYEFWLFSGTNVDLLDGPKLKELYFKGSYLVNMGNGKNNTQKSNSWMHFTFGKNRFFAEPDSLLKVPVNAFVQEQSTADTFAIARGSFSALREIATNNLFISADYLYELEGLASPWSNFFLTTGTYIGIQAVETSFSNSKLVFSDTIRRPRVRDTIAIPNPALENFTIRNVYTNFDIGFLHILSTDKINVKTAIKGGLNFFTYPYRIRRSSRNEEFAQYETSLMPFARLRIEGTVLNPGISIGFETFVHKGALPFYNVSLTKVLDLEKLGDLFGKISPISYGE